MMIEFKTGDKVQCIKECEIKIQALGCFYYRATLGEIFIVENNYGSDRFFMLKSKDDIKSIQLKKNFELIEKNKVEKEEFKVDKLGWYEVESNSIKKIEIVYIDSVNKHSIGRFKEFLWEFEEFGKCVEQEMNCLCLTKYLGPELPKEPRKFEFEMYLKECLSDYIQDFDSIKKQAKLFKFKIEEILE